MTLAQNRLRAGFVRAIGVTIDEHDGRGFDAELFKLRAQRDESLLVERLPADDGDTVALQPLMLVDGSDVVDGDDLASVTVSARVVGHERGPKLRVVKFKPKRGYKRRTGHRQELTRLEVTSLGRKAARSRSRPAKAPADVADSGEANTTATTSEAGNGS